MAEHEPPIDRNDNPEDVASLYSWANLHGSKYRDFSASRAQMREQVRQRVEEAMERPGTDNAAIYTESQASAASPASSAPSVSQYSVAGPAVPRVQVPPSFPPEPTAPDAASYWRAVPPTPSVQNAPAGYSEAKSPRVSNEAPISGARSPWPEAAPGAGSQFGANAPSDSGSREHLNSRWFALRTVFGGVAGAGEGAAPRYSSRPPVLAVFSLAGGVGKTSVVATLGRALSSRGERVLLVDTAAYGLLPFYFGACDQRPGVLRTFRPPAGTGDAPIQTLTVDPEALGPEDQEHDPLVREIGRHGNGTSRILIDVGTASGATTRKVLRMGPTILVPIVPDMSSAVSVHAIDAFFQRNGSRQAGQNQPFYIFNQFDSSFALHMDVREMLQERLGDRLLPFVLRESQTVSEALAEGMTVMDYVPDSPVTEDFDRLVVWVKKQAAPASTGYRGIRWSER